MGAWQFGDRVWDVVLEIDSVWDVGKGLRGYVLVNRMGLDEVYKVERV